MFDEINEQNRAKGKVAICNIVIVALNVIIYAYLEMKGSVKDTEFMLDYGAMYWPYVRDYGEWYRLITCMFLHFGTDHLFNNMMILFFAGDKLEKTVGKIKYLSIYFISGILASLTSMYYNMLKERAVVSVGASGAIYGLMGAVLYITLFNNEGRERVSRRQIMFFILLTVYYGSSGRNVDNAAHIGGFTAGLIISFLLLRSKKFRNVKEEVGQ